MANKRGNATLSILFLLFFGGILVLSLNVVVVSVLGIHINSGVNISNYANNISLHKEKLTARRGFIYDRNGEIIAQDVDQYNIYAILSKDIPSLPGQIAYVDNKERTAELLAPLLNMTYEECYSYMDSNAYQVEFGVKGRGLSQTKKEEIEALRLNGIGFTKSSGRIYPYGTFASHLIGFAQYDAEKQRIIGRMGLEATLEEFLTGKDGYVEYQQDTKGFMLPGTKRNEVPPVNGNDVYLTLDATIQLYLEDGLEAAMEKFKPTRAWAVVMEVKTGKILGYSSYPSFNANIKDIKSYIDIPVGYAFEPGSTMKSFLYAAAMDTGKYEGNTPLKSGLFHVGIKDGKFVRLNSKSEKGYIGTVQDYNQGKGWGDITLDEGLIRSSNTAVVTLLINSVGTATYRDYLERFGFFKKTEFEAVGEQAGSINYMYGMEKITPAYGQGLTVNTIQLLQAYTAIFNGGTMLKPYVIDSIRNPYTQEVVYQGTKTVVGTPIKESTAKELTQLLTHVVQDSAIGSARFYQIPEVEMAGKTGTAEIAGNGGYQSGAGNNLYSIMVAAPAKDPEVMIFYALEQPNTKSVHDNTDIFKQIFRNTILYLGINDEESMQKAEEKQAVLYEPKEILSYVNQPVAKAKEALEKSGFQVIVIGDGLDVVSQYPAANTTVMTSQKVFLYTGRQKIVMPDMKGWSRKDVIAFWKLCGIPVESSGEGFVVEQNIEPGELITMDDVIQVRFEHGSSKVKEPAKANQGG